MDSFVKKGYWVFACFFAYFSKNLPLLESVLAVVHKKHDFPKTSPNRPQNEKKVPKKLGIILGTFWGLFSRII